MFDKGAPAGANIQHAVSGFQTGRFNRKIQLASHGIFQWLVIGEKNSLRITAMLSVEEQAIEVAIIIVVMRDRLLIVGYLSEYEWTDEAPDEMQGMAIGEHVP